MNKKICFSFLLCSVTLQFFSSGLLGSGLSESPPSVSSTLPASGSVQNLSVLNSTSSNLAKIPSIRVVNEHEPIHQPTDSQRFSGPLSSIAVAFQAGVTRIDQWHNDHDDDDFIAHQQHQQQHLQQQELAEVCRTIRPEPVVKKKNKSVALQDDKHSIFAQGTIHLPSDRKRPETFAQFVARKQQEDLQRLKVDSVANSITPIHSMVVSSVSQQQRSVSRKKNVTQVPIDLTVVHVDQKRSGSACSGSTSQKKSSARPDSGFIASVMQEMDKKKKNQLHQGPWRS